MFSRCSQDAPMGLVDLMEFDDHFSMDQRNSMIPNYPMIPAIWWSPAIRWSPAIQWSMDFDNPKVYGDTSITDDLVNIWNRNTKVQLRLDGWAGNKPYATDFLFSSNFAPAILRPPPCKQTTQQVKNLVWNNNSWGIAGHLEFYNNSSDKIKQEDTCCSYWLCWLEKAIINISLPDTADVGWCISPPIGPLLACGWNECV